MSSKLVTVSINALIYVLIYFSVTGSKYIDTFGIGLANMDPILT